MSILDPRILLAVLLAIAASFGAGYWKGEKSGKAEIQAMWTASELKRSEEARQADLENRRIENLRQSRVQEATNAQRKRESVLRRTAADTRSELDRLLDSLNRPSTSDVPSSPPDAVSKRIATLETVFGQCARQLADMAEVADRHASDSLMYQEAWPGK